MSEHLKHMLERAFEAKKQMRETKETEAQKETIIHNMVMALTPDDVSNKVADRLEEAITPILERLLDRERLSSEDIVNAISQIHMKIPDMQIPEIKVPEAKVTVHVPKITVPDIVMPDEMITRGWLHVMGYDKALLGDPLPVQIRGADGSPVNFGAFGGGVATGGKADYLTIKGFSQSAYTELMNADGRLRVSMETGSAGLTDTELRASSVPVSQVSGAIWSTAVIDIFGSTAASNVFNADNRIKVSVETGSGLTDAELRATAVPVAQVSGARWSTEATQGTSPWVVSATALDIRSLANATDSVSVYQVSGHRWSTEATQSGTWNITSITNSAAAALVDSSGVQYSGSNPVPVSVGNTVTVTGSLTSTVVTGPTAVNVNDDGTAPVQSGGIARTANPTAVSGGNVVKTTHDDLGRQLIRPVQVRDLIQTAYVQLTNGTETTLLAASAGSFHDLIYVMGANNSDAAVSVDIRPVTAGNVIMNIQIPANSTAGIACPVPLPQSASDTGNNWTADMADITGTTVSLTALFTREV